MSPEEIDLSITGETLTLRGERKRPEGVADESYRRQERPFGRWTRTVTLPDRVESGQVSASYAQGVLTVHASQGRERQAASHLGVGRELTEMTGDGFRMRDSLRANDRRQRVLER